MAEKGVKIKELARELGVTSRALIDRCRAEGMPAQNSITRLSPSDARRMRLIFTHPSPQDPDSEDRTLQP